MTNHPNRSQKAEKIAAVEAELRASLPTVSADDIRYAAERLVEMWPTKKAGQ